MFPATSSITPTMNLLLQLIWLVQSAYLMSLTYYPFLTIIFLNQNWDIDL